MGLDSLDLDFVRAQFPAKCWELAFFENAGGSFVPNTVIQRMTDYMKENQVQPGSTYPMAELAQQRINITCSSARPIQVNRTLSHTNSSDLSRPVMTDEYS